MPSHERSDKEGGVVRFQTVRQSVLLSYVNEVILTYANFCYFLLCFGALRNDWLILAFAYRVSEPKLIVVEPAR
jgi:hypothetical protein